MDDTKKLIEKYKRELMELSRRSASPPAAVKEPSKPAVVPVIDDEEISETVEVTQPQDTQEEVTEAVISVTEPAVETASEPVSEPERKPKIIGYVSEESGEFPAVYDRFLAEIIENDESINPGDIDENTVCSADQSEPPADPPEPPAAAPEVSSSPEPKKDVLDLSDVLFTPPGRRKIPSTQQIREDITEQSDPSENYPAENVSGVTDNSATAPRPDLADVQSVSEEKAETLADQPISGTEEGEQLTGRSFEDESYPQNPEAPSDSIMRQGSGAEPIDYPEPVYDSYEDFVRRNIGRGTILFRVYTAQEALPIMGAKCVISKKIGGETRELCSLITDSSGQTRAETLPAPSKELSQSFENSVQPFSLYDATVTKNGYADVELRDIPVFDGVQSIQRVAMVPAASEETERITEVENAR